MQNTARRVLDHRAPDLPQVPSRVMSLDGQLIDTSAVCWRFRSSSDGGKVILIPWDRLDEPAILSDRARYFAKLFLADKISRKKARTIENDFRMFRRFQDWLGSIRRASFDWSDQPKDWHERFSLTAWNTPPTRVTTSPGSVRCIAGEWRGSTGISIQGCSVFCSRSPPWGTPRGTTCDSGSAQGAVFAG